MDATEMPRRERNAGVDGKNAPVGRVRGRSPSTLSTGGGEAGPLGPGQRWSVARKHAVALRLIAGEPGELLSREIGVPVYKLERWLYKLERWREKAEAALDEALKEREAGTEGAELAAALQRIGELSMEVERLRARIERTGAVGRRSAGSNPSRFRPLALVGQGPSQGLGAPARAGRPARRAQAGAAADARARPALAAPRQVAAPRRPRPHHRDRRAEHHVGHRRHAGRHGAGRQGLAFRRRRALERRGPRLARQRARHASGGACRAMAWPCASTAILATTQPAACGCATTTAVASWPRISRPRSGPGA